LAAKRLAERRLAEVGGVLVSGEEVVGALDIVARTPFCGQVADTNKIMKNLAGQTSRKVLACPDTGTREPVGGAADKMEVDLQTLRGRQELRDRRDHALLGGEPGDVAVVAVACKNEDVQVHHPAFTDKLQSLVQALATT
jgi:hypothetical protein